MRNVSNKPVEYKDLLPGYYWSRYYSPEGSWQFTDFRIVEIAGTAPIMVVIDVSEGYQIELKHRIMGVLYFYGPIEGPPAKPEA